MDIEKFKKAKQLVDELSDLEDIRIAFEAPIDYRCAVFVAECSGKRYVIPKETEADILDIIKRHKDQLQKEFEEL